MSYSKRYSGGFVDLPSATTAIDSQYLNGVEASLLRLDNADPTVDGQVLQWIQASSRYGPALLLDKNIDPAAAISKSKLNLTGQITDADIAGNAAISKSKLAPLSITDADVAVPISGAKLLPVRVATTVAGLGTAGNGALGLVRCGATPFQFVAVIYDSTLGKWVSTQILFVTSANNSLTTSATYVAGTNYSQLNRYPFKPYSDAGLSWQFQWRALVQTQAATTAFGLKLAALTGNVGGSGFVQDTANTFAEDTTVTVANNERFTDWTPINPSVVVTDELQVGFMVKSDGTRNNGVANGIQALQVYGRLVG